VRAVVAWACRRRVGSIDPKTQWKETPLHFATRNNKLNCVKSLVESGASRTAVTYGGDTALQLAEKYKFAPIVEYLSSK
jgi:ankyrin repeat protein